MTGRWLSKDPISLAGGVNLYAFCANDPVNFRDPEGEAYIAERPLDWGLNQASADFCFDRGWGGLHENQKLHHEQIIFEDREEPKDVGFFKHRGVCEDDKTFVPYLRWQKEKYDDKIMREAVQRLIDSGNWTPDKYDTFQHNCQDFVDAAIQVYHEIENSMK